MKAFLKKYSFVLITGLAFIGTLIAYNAFVKTDSFQSLFVWASDHLIWFCLILIGIKIIGIVWPPLPGLVFIIGAIPIIGWIPALLIDVFAALIGSCLVFFIARRYGPPVILKVFGQSGLRQVQRLQFNPTNELEAVILMRVFGGPVSELVSYGAGLTKISFRNFFLGTLFSNLAIGLPMFYLLGLAFGSSNLFYGAIPLVLGILLMYALRGRYFVVED